MDLFDSRLAGKNPILRWAFLSLCLTLISLSGCKPQEGEENDSDLLWGHVTISKRKWMAAEPPKQKIFICDKGGQDVPLYAMTKDAFNAWAGVIRRKGHYRIAPGCSKSRADRRAKNRRYIKVRTAPKSPDCRGGLGYASPMTGWITLCQKISDRRMLKSAIFHEMGHLWGLCDQYDPKLVKRESGYRTMCKQDHDRHADPDSLMGNPEPGKTLTADDRDGIRAVACLSGIPNKAKWDRLVGREKNCQKYR